MTKLEEIEARRAERKAALDDQRKAQLAEDLEALDALEVEHGDANVARVNVPYTPGLPTFVVVRAPKAAEFKRYKERIKSRRDGTPGDPVFAADELGECTRVYPDKETFSKMLEARPGLTTPMGVASSNMGTGRADESGKE